MNPSHNKKTWMFLIWSWEFLPGWSWTIFQFLISFCSGTATVPLVVSLWRQRLRDAEKMEVIESGASGDLENRLTELQPLELGMEIFNLSSNCPNQANHVLKWYWVQCIMANRLMMISMTSLFRVEFCAVKFSNLFRGFCLNLKLLKHLKHLLRFQVGIWWTSFWERVNHFLA